MGAWLWELDLCCFQDAHPALVDRVFPDLYFQIRQLPDRVRCSDGDAFRFELDRIADSEYSPQGIVSEIIMLYFGWRRRDPATYNARGPQS